MYLYSKPQSSEPTHESHEAEPIGTLPADFFSMDKVEEAE